MKGYIERPTGELSQIIQDHDLIHQLPKNHCLSGVLVSAACQDVTTNMVIPHPTEAKEAMYVDLNITYEQSLLPDGKLWDSQVFVNDTFLTESEINDLGYNNDSID